MLGLRLRLRMRLLALAALAVALGSSPTGAVVSRKPSRAPTAEDGTPDTTEASGGDKGVEIVAVHGAEGTASNCVTPGGIPGSCVRLQNCTQLYALAQQRVTSLQVDFLRKSQCGFEGRSPKVCCPQKGRAPSQGGGVPDWSKVSGFTPVPPEGLSRDTFPDVPRLWHGTCGQQAGRPSLSRVVGGQPARSDGRVCEDPPATFNRLMFTPARSKPIVGACNA